MKNKFSIIILISLLFLISCNNTEKLDFIKKEIESNRDLPIKEASKIKDKGEQAISDIGGILLTENNSELVGKYVIDDINTVKNGTRYKVSMKEGLYLFKLPNNSGYIQFFNSNKSEDSYIKSFNNDKKVTSNNENTHNSTDIISIIEYNDGNIDLIITNSLGRKHTIGFVKGYFTKQVIKKDKKVVLDNKVIDEGLVENNKYEEIILEEATIKYKDLEPGLTESQIRKSKYSEFSLFSSKPEFIGKYVINNIKEVENKTSYHLGMKEGLYLFKLPDDSGYIEFLNNKKSKNSYIKILNKNKEEVGKIENTYMLMGGVSSPVVFIYNDGNIEISKGGFEGPGQSSFYIKDLDLFISRHNLIYKFIPKDKRIGFNTFILRGNTINFHTWPSLWTEESHGVSFLVDLENEDDIIYMELIKTGKNKNIYSGKIEDSSYKIIGKIGDKNISKITVTHETMIDGKEEKSHYTLKQFKEFDKSFVYNISSKLGNLVDSSRTYRGYNNYKSYIQ